MNSSQPVSSARPRTLFEKVWDSHVVKQDPGAPAVLYIDAHLVHEVTSPQAFAMLRERGLKVRRPDRTFATMDHAIPTRQVVGASTPIELWPLDAAIQVRTLRQNAHDFGITLWDIEGDVQGIVHVVGPEMGVTQPGMTIVCGDSHTSTHGAFGALAFGIGTSEVGHVLATQTLLQDRPKTFAINVEGEIGFGVTAKDIILGIIAKNGAGGGAGYVFEYRGSAIRVAVPESRGYKHTAQGRPRRRLFSGRGIDTDIIVASAKAYMQALNKLLAAEDDDRRPTADREDDD